MSFRLWHYIGRIVFPLLFLAAIMAIVARRGTLLWGMGVGAFLALFALGLVGGVGGVLFSLGKLRLRCPFCGEKRVVCGIPGGLALDCPACGLVYEIGFLKLQLARAAPEMPQACDEQTMEEMPPELREELSVFPRGWVYFRHWRTLRWFLLMLLAPATGLAAAWWRGQRVGGIILFVMGAVFAAVAFVSLASGVSSSNWGTFTRAREPVRFWVDVAILAAVCAAISAAGWIIK